MSVAAAPSGVRLHAISCPSCGGSAGSLLPGDVRACPYCSVPLTLVAPGVAGSAMVDPSVDEARARRIVEGFLATPGTPPGLKERAARRGLDLVFVPWYDTLLVEAAEAPPVLRARLSVARFTALALEGDGREIGADRIDPERVRNAPKAGYDAVAMAARGTVLDARRDPESVRIQNLLADPVTIERRIRVVYYPLWLARFSFGRSLYQVAVDGLTGEILRGVAPARMDRRVLQGVFFTLFFSILLAVVVANPGILLEMILHIADTGALIAGGLLLVLAAAWDRLRFRREVIVEGPARRFQPINRPKQTTLEQMAAFFFDRVRSRRRRSPIWGGP